jgi:NADPH2:quinone reductase
MRALICRELGPPQNLELGELPSPDVGATSVKIRVRAAGLNFPDVLVVQGKYQVKPPLPFVPGAEVAGEVLAVGAKVTAFAPGDRVMALPQFGGFAEEAVAHVESVFAIPATMSDAQAAGFPLTYGTTYHALVDRAHLRAGEWLLVTGAGGGVGLNAVELGAAFGARVIAAASSPEKLAAARSRGAAHTIDYSHENLVEKVKEITGGNGADVVYDPVGGDVFDAALKTLAWHGRLLVVGFAAGRIPDVPANRVLLKESSVVGVFWGAFAARDPAANRANFEALFALFAEGKLDPPILSRYPLERAKDAIVDLMERRIIGKAVVEVA